MTHLRELNNANTAKIMAETFGRYNIFATLSLSLIAQTRAYTGQKLAGARVNIRLFMQKCMGSLFVFYPHQ